jgi:hypothetical protein
MTSRPGEPLILDLLEWLGAEGQSYKDAMERWQTSCPRLDVWETALSRGLLRCVFVEGRGLQVELTDAGLAHLRASRPATAELRGWP